MKEGESFHLDRLCNVHMKYDAVVTIRQFQAPVILCESRENVGYKHGR